MLWGTLVAECYFRAWMVLHPTYLIRLLLATALVGTLILGPLVAMNWHLAARGI